MDNKKDSKCFSLEEFCEYFTIKYDINISEEEKEKLLEKFSNKIKHAETCKKCSKILKYGESLYNDIYRYSAPNKLDAFIKNFIRDYNKYMETKEQAEKVCDVVGHKFDSWLYHEWIYGINNENIDYEWYRECKRCGFVEETKEEPKDSKARIRVRINN